MADRYVYEITLTRDEQDVVEGELAGVIERNEPDSSEWNPTEWKALNSAWKKIADARAVIRPGGGRKGSKGSRPSSGSGIRGMR